jgi:hypothetical protein
MLQPKALVPQGFSRSETLERNAMSKGRIMAMAQRDANNEGKPKAVEGEAIIGVIYPRNGHYWKLSAARAR